MTLHRQRRWGRLLLLAPLLLLGLGTILQPAPAAHAESVTGTITVGNNPWGLAYDSGAGEIFVANSGAGRTVSVICDGKDTSICSTGANTVAATITLPSGNTELTGVAYDSGAGEIFVASQGGGTVSVICDGTDSNCGAQNAIATTIGPAVSGLSCSSTCEGLYVANGVVYDPSTSEIYVTTGDCVSSDCYVYVISDSTNTVTAAIAIGSSPGYAAGLAYDSGAGEIFVPIYSTGKVEVICDGTNTSICNTGVNTVAATIALPSGSQPEAIAYDSSKGEIFVENYGGTVLVYCDGTDSGCGAKNSLAATIDFASDLNPGIGYDPSTGEVFVSVLSYYVSAISDSTDAVTATMYVGLGPYSIAYDSAVGETFASVSDSNAVAVIPNPTLTLAPSSVSTGGSTTLSGSNYLSSSVLDGESCATYSGYVYCVGGYAASVYLSTTTYGQLSSSGVGSWLSGTAYPSSAFEPSCAIDQSSGYIYCVGGYTGSSYSSAVYYAQVSSGGIGSWTSTTSYPDNVDLESCAIYSGHIYCVAGYTGSAYLSAVYYAQLSPSGGISGSWSSTSTYPSAVYGLSCAVDSSSGYIYCMGGYTGSSYISTVEYASLSSSGVGSWTSTTAYPTDLYVGSCAISSGYMYCVDGYTGSAFASAVYYTQLSASGGVSGASWSSTTAYPISIDRESCTISSGYIYCVGGNTGSGYVSSVYYGPASSSGVASWTSSSQYSISQGYNYCFESGVLSSPTACPSTYHFTATSSGGIPSSTTLTASGSTGLVVVSSAGTGSVVSSALVTLYADPTVAVTPTGPLTYDVGQTPSALGATITYTGPDTTSVEWYSAAASTCSASYTDTHVSALALTPSTASAGTTYYCAVVSDSGVPGYAFTSNAVEVTVDADPTVTVAPVGPLSYDVGQTASGLTATLTYTGPNTASVEWYSSAGATCSSSSTDTTKSGSSFIPGTSSTGTTYYCAVVSDSGVPGYSSASGAVEVTVSPLTSPSVPEFPFQLAVPILFLVSAVVYLTLKQRFVRRASVPAVDSGRPGGAMHSECE